MLGRIVAIAGNAFREAVRDRVLYNSCFSLTPHRRRASSVSFRGQERKIIVDLGLSAMLCLGLIAILSASDWSTKKLSGARYRSCKPVGRGGFVGQVFGTVPHSTGKVLVMGGVFPCPDLCERWL